jgi:glycyl-tRNA synthetase beta chain
VTGSYDLDSVRASLTEAAERALMTALDESEPRITQALARQEYRDAFTAIAALRDTVATFFDDVLVMAEDRALRTARLGLVARLRDLVLGIADISEIAPES